MKRFTIALCLVLVLVACAFAQNSKATFKVGTMTLVAGDVQAFQPVTSAVIKTASGTDVMIGVSLETSLVTNTVVASKAYEKSSSTAEAGVYVQVLVDGVPAEPGQVTFDRRKQTMVAKLDGWSCTDLNGDNAVTYDECTYTPEEIQLILDTTAAHHFNFIVNDLASGEHTIAVQASLFKQADGSGPTLGNASAAAWIGKGSLVVEEVKLANTGSGASISLN